MILLERISGALGCPWKAKLGILSGVSGEPTLNQVLAPSHPRKFTL